MRSLTAPVLVIALVIWLPAESVKVVSTPAPATPLVFPMVLVTKVPAESVKVVVAAAPLVPVPVPVPELTEPDEPEAVEPATVVVWVKAEPASGKFWHRWKYSFTYRRYRCQ